MRSFWGRGGKADTLLLKSNEGTHAGSTPAGPTKGN